MTNSQGTIKSLSGNLHNTGTHSAKPLVSRTHHPIIMLCLCRNSQKFQMGFDGTLTLETIVSGQKGGGAESGKPATLNLSVTESPEVIMPVAHSYSGQGISSGYTRTPTLPFQSPGFFHRISWWFYRMLDSLHIHVSCIGNGWCHKLTVSATFCQCINGCTPKDQSTCLSLPAQPAENYTSKCTYCGIWQQLEGCIKEHVGVGSLGTKAWWRRCTVAS